LEGADPTVVCTKNLHDAVSRRNAHEPIYPVPVLAEIFGPDGYFDHAPSVQESGCRCDTGEVKVVKYRREEHWGRMDSA
jgi:hypothetical protein